MGYTARGGRTVLLNLVVVLDRHSVGGVLSRPRRIG